jgi:hypothetical protein
VESVRKRLIDQLSVREQEALAGIFGHVTDELREQFMRESKEK